MCVVWVVKNWFFLSFSFQMGMIWRTSYNCSTISSWLCIVYKHICNDMVVLFLLLLLYYYNFDANIFFFWFIDVIKSHYGPKIMYYQRYAVVNFWYPFGYLVKSNDNLSNLWERLSIYLNVFSLFTISSKTKINLYEIYCNYIIV